MRRTLLFITIQMALFSATCSWAQSTRGQADRSSVYFLNDTLHQQWCGYSDLTRFKKQIQSLRAMVVGDVEYLNNRASVVRRTQTDETGDWAINDEYVLDQNENIQSIKRTINFLPEDMTQEQNFRVQNGRTIKVSSTIRDLRTKELIPRTVDLIEGVPPVFNNIQSFPFARLILGKRREIQMNGEFCLSVTSKN